MHWHHRGKGPCRWISIAETGPAPFVVAYRRLFSLEHDATFKIHVTADERYELYLDGERIGRGCERGDTYNWSYETYKLTIPAGDHSLVAKTWMPGAGAPAAQLGVSHGFLCSAEGEFIDIVGSGVAEWQAKRIEGISFKSCEMSWSGGKRNEIDGSIYPWGFESRGIAGRHNRHRAHNDIFHSLPVRGFRENRPRRRSVQTSGPLV